MKRLAYAYVFLMFFVLAAHTAKAEVIFFNDSAYQAIVRPASARWIPGHSGGICTSATAAPGGLCGPGTGTDESVWGNLGPPTPGATVDTDVAHYGSLTPIPFNNFLWVTEPELGLSSIFGDYLYSFVYPAADALYLQFNSALPEGFGCNGAVLLIGTCEHTIAENGLTTAGYVRWSDGSFDQITFESGDHPVREPSVLLLLATGLVSILWRSRSVRART